MQIVLQVPDHFIQLPEKMRQKALSKAQEALREEIKQSQNELTGWKEQWKNVEEKTFGLWKDRTDLPDFQELRNSWDRFEYLGEGNAD